MDAKLSVVVQRFCHLLPLCHTRHNHRSDHSPYVVAVLSSSPDKPVQLSGTMTSGSVYKDNWFDRIAINHLSQSLQETTGSKQKLLWIGPCEVRESEFDGTKEKNVVHIKKCRFLEGTNCVGMCTSLCKMSSQVFIKDSLGMPLNMVPSKENKKNHKNCTSQ